MDHVHRAAGGRDRGNAHRVLHPHGGGEAGPVGAEGGEQPGGEDRAGAGQAGKDGGVGMGREEGGNRPVKCRDVLADRQQQIGEHGRVQDCGEDDGRIRGERFGIVNDLEAVRNDRRFPTAVGQVEVAEGVGRGLVEGVERRIGQ